MLTLLAPAKLNLTLEVLAKRPDGYHEIRSVIQTINLCDRLCFQPSQNITFKSNLPDWIPEKSLISKVVSLLQETTGSAKGVTIEVTKHIPLLSGLGGDSSDAATTLRGLNKLWELNLPPSKLLELATELGSDVAFFLYGGTALIEGRGERVTPLPSLPPIWVILVVPEIPRPQGKTKKLYSSLNSSHYSDGQITQKLVVALKEKQEFTPLIFNTFEEVAFAQFPGLNVYWEHLREAGADNIHLAGSGPTLFTLLKNKARAEELYHRLQQKGLQTYLTHPLASIDEIE